MDSLKFLKQFKNNRHIDANIRIYIISKHKHYFINNGKLTEGFHSQLSIEKNRDSVLTAFSKMAFLFDEIIRLRIVGASNSTNSNELLYILNLVPVNRKIRTFLDWKVFGPEFTRDMSRLFEVRNDTIHCVSLDEVVYRPDNLVPLSNASGFRIFKKDLQKCWKKLLEVYLKEQEKINWEKMFKSL